jgi:hypothetical protein
LLTDSAPDECSPQRALEYLIMIRTVSTRSGVGLAASVGGIAIYLDNWAIKAFAKGNPELSERFIATVKKGADVLFSTNHVVEALGPQNKSADAFKAFLNRLGPHWYPVTANVFDVIEREKRALSPSDCGYDEELLISYYQSKTAQAVPGSGKIVDPSSEDFFALGSLIEFSAHRREYFVAKSAEFNSSMKDYVEKLRHKFKKNPAWLDAVLPSIPFHPSRPAMFAFVHLMRELISNSSGYQIKDGDAMDLGHAVIASAFSNFATLDGQWKKRVENLPKPNRNPRLYYEPELGAMVSDIEGVLSQYESMRDRRILLPYPPRILC